MLLIIMLPYSGCERRDRDTGSQRRNRAERNEMKSLLTHTHTVVTVIATTADLARCVSGGRVSRLRASSCRYPMLRSSSSRDVKGLTWHTARRCRCRRSEFDMDTLHTRCLYDLHIIIYYYCYVRPKSRFLSLFI